MVNVLYRQKPSKYIFYTIYVYYFVLQDGTKLSLQEKRKRHPEPITGDTTHFFTDVLDTSEVRIV